LFIEVLLTHFFCKPDLYSAASCGAAYVRACVPRHRSSYHRHSVIRLSGRKAQLIRSLASLQSLPSRSDALTGLSLNCCYRALKPAYDSRCTSQIRGKVGVYSACGYDYVATLIEVSCFVSPGLLKRCASGVGSRREKKKKGGSSHVSLHVNPLARSGDKTC